MSRFDPKDRAKAVLEASKHWRETALVKDGSVFTDASVWNSDNVDSLRRYFSDALDYGEGSYMEKLERQLSEAPKPAIWLAAEFHWLMLLSPSNTHPPSKRASFQQIWEWSGDPAPMDSPWLSDAVLQGVGSAGTAFNTQRWREFQFGIDFLTAWKQLPEAERNSLLSDGWQFAEWLRSIDNEDKRQLRHMLLWMLFPDDFEPTFGGLDRKAITAAFTGMSRKEVKKLAPLDIDRKLKVIREQQEEKLGTNELSFYTSPLREVWQKPTLAEQTQDIAAEHILAALQEIDQNGIPDDARSTTYDLVHASKRYPPKYVLALAASQAGAEELDRTEFSGGEASQAFKILRSLGFHIERKDLLADMITRFLTQASTRSSLNVSDYPKTYRELKVNVSFGKGNFARIPWISFTGYGQRTQNGIYPVLLYYASANKLVLAYGVSETNLPEANWSNADRGRTVKDVLNEDGIAPERYGSSYFHSSYDVDSLDLDVLQNAVNLLIDEYHQQFTGEGGPTEDATVEQPYSIDDALEELFIDRVALQSMIELLERKKNLILQGPPGVGKTYVCKRLAFALIGAWVPDRVEMVQFHQSYSYEDFVQGYRPSAGGFRLKNGIFWNFCNRAKDDPTNQYVFIIDEFNRGNVSKIFGELMVLLEADKREPGWAMPLTYAEDSSETFYVPENVFVIGLMNTADRSLAMVDYALRRRFAFVDLKPMFDSPKFRESLTEAGASPSFIDRMSGRMQRLNDRISSDATNLGRGFCIGHSFFCNIPEDDVPNDAWFAEIVSNEIAPLLHEYWFDNPNQAESLIQELLA